MSKCQFEAAIKEMKTFIQERMKGKFVSADTKEVLQGKLEEIAKMELMVRKLQGTVRVTNVSEVVVSRPTETKKDFRSEFKKKRPSAAKWVDKEGAKFDVATQAISDGTKDSTAGFVKDFYGDKANTGTYTKDDVVYLSTNGNRAGRVVPVKNGELQGAYKNIDKAIKAGAKFVADTSKHLANTGKYNVGEVELAEYLQSKGYTREDKDGYGLWSPGKAKEVVSDKLKIMNGTITDKDGKASIQVNSMEELRGLSEEFNKLMKELGMGPETTTDKIYQDGFDMLEKAGIEFKPFKLTFKKELKSGGYGTHNTKSGNIDVATGVTYNRNPQGILLHEYAHRISSEKLDKFPVLRSKIEKLMEHARKNGVTGYGMTDRYEFIAETISNPKFQEKLSKVPSYEGKGIVETVRLVFSKLLERVTGKEASALTDGLDLIVRLTKAEVDEQVADDNLVKGIWNKVEYTYSKDLDKLYSKGKEVWVDKANPQRAQIVTSLVEPVSKIANIETTTTGGKEVSGSKDSYTLPGGMKTNKGQTEAINTLKKWYAGKDLTFLLKGRGGTGKTTVIGKAVKELGLRDTDVVYAAYMNKAVGVIESANKRNGNRESSYVTTAQILGLKPKFNEHTGVTTFVPDDKASDPLVYKKLLVIDEASMLPNGQQKQIEQRAKSMGIRIIYMGDDVQLPPVNEVIGGVVTKTAKVFEEHIGKENFSELVERMRQGEESPILPVTDALAKAVIEGKSFVEADLGFVTKYDKSKDEGVVFTDRWDNDVLEAFVNDYRLDPKGTRFIHYNTFDNINTLNKVNAIRSALFKDKAQGVENKFIVGEQVTFNEPYYKKIGGDMVYKVDNSTEATITKAKYEPNYGVDYFHGKQERTAFMPVYVVDAIDNFTGEKYDKIIIPAMTNKDLKVYREALKTKYGVYQGGLDGELATVGHAYVITSHKSQGSTYSTAYADLGNIASMPIDEDLKLKSAYVATSRASKKLVVLDPRASKSSIPRSKVALKEKDDKIKADQQYRKLLNGMKDC